VAGDGRLAPAHRLFDGGALHGEPLNGAVAAVSFGGFGGQFRIALVTGPGSHSRSLISRPSTIATRSTPSS
jgi:hypothetical protein